MVQDQTNATDKARARLTWENVFVAFAMSGPERALPTSNSIRLAELTVLMILRSLITSWVALASRATEPKIVDAIFFCAQDLPLGLESDQAAIPTENNDTAPRDMPVSDRIEHYAIVKNKFFFGVGDTLGFLLASLSADAFSPSLDSDEFAAIAMSTSSDLLAGHSKRKEFQKWLEAKPDGSRSAVISSIVSSLGLLDYFGTKTKWKFWREWYQSIIDGEPISLGLQRQIALISNANWDEGPSHIAKKIEEIRRDFDKPKLDSDQLTEQAKRLAANPKTTDLIASSTADMIEHCVHEYMLAENLNLLPDTLAPLHTIPPLLRAMGENAQDSDKISELEAQIADLVGEVARLTTALEAAKKFNIAKTAVETTVKIATTTFWGSIAAGVTHMTGIVDVGTLLERLSEIGNAPPALEQLNPPKPELTIEV